MARFCQFVFGLLFFQSSCFGFCFSQCLSFFLSLSLFHCFSVFVAVRLLVVVLFCCGVLRVVSFTECLFFVVVLFCYCFSETEHLCPLSASLYVCPCLSVIAGMMI